MPRPPRFGDAPRRGLAPASAEEVARLMRRAALASGALVVWALAGVLLALTGALQILLATGAVLAIVAVVALVLDLRAPSRARSTVAASSATLAIACAVAAHVLYWGGPVRDLFLLDVAPLLRIGIVVSLLLLVPLYAGLRQRALAHAWRASGSRARGPLTLFAALGDPLWRGALARWGEGAALPGLLVLDLALGARRPADRLHAEASFDTLAKALAAHGVTSEAQGRDLVVRLPDAPALTLTATRGFLPAGPLILLRGEVAAARRLRRLLEGEAGHALVFSWSAPARRWELRLNALHREALAADTLEERSLVMEELDRIKHALSERALCGEEFCILSMKEREARTLLAHRMLSEPPGNRGEARSISQHGALMPDMARVLDAGGLASVKRVAFVPHWIVPIQTAWGEEEAVVNAATGRLDAVESHALLDAMHRRGPVLFLDVGANAVFLPAPPPTGAILREMRAAGLRVSDDVATGVAPADVIYVPYLATAHGYASGVTGRIAPDLGSAVPVAPA